MKPIMRLITVTGLLLVTAQCWAIEGIKILISCPDVVLSWPSVADETYIVQYRESFDSVSPWITLTNLLPASIGTNTTSFVHSNQVNCPTGQVFGMMNLNDLQSGTTLTTGTAPLLTDADRQRISLERELKRLNALFAQCKVEGREPLAWELDNRPPFPWEAFAVPYRPMHSGLQADAASTGILSEGPTPQGADPDGASPPVAGFYRVVRTGIHFFAFTNTPSFSGTVEIPFELGTTNAGQPGIRLIVDGAAAVASTIETGSHGTPATLQTDRMKWFFTPTSQVRLRKCSAPPIWSRSPTWFRSRWR